MSKECKAPEPIEYFQTLEKSIEELGNGIQLLSESLSYAMTDLTEGETPCIDVSSSCELERYLVRLTDKITYLNDRINSIKRRIRLPKEMKGGRSI